MDNSIALLFLGIFTVSVIFYMMVVMQQVAQPIISLENITFAGNNTNVNFAHNPVYTDDLTLYYFDNTSFPIPKSLYTASTTQIKIYNNCSAYDDCDELSYPNVTNGTGSFYYASYSYQTNATIWDVDYNWVGLLVLMAVVYFGALHSFANKKIK